MYEPVTRGTSSHRPTLTSLVSPFVAASRRYPSTFFNEWALNVIDPDTGEYLTHRQLRRHPKLGPKWDASYRKELGHLYQGLGKGSTSTGQHGKGTDTFYPVLFGNIPHDRLKCVTVISVVCKFRPVKGKPNRTRITIMGKNCVYAGDAGTKTASLDLCKLLFNSVISRKGAKFITYDITNYYLATPLDYPEYTRIKLTNIPQDLINEYNLHDFVHNQWVYFEIQNGVYGLPR